MSGLSRHECFPQKHRRLAIQGFLIICILLVMLTFVATYPFAGFLQTHLGGLPYLLIAVGAFVILFVLSAAGFVLRLIVRMRRMSNPRHALKVARACGG